MSRRGVTESEPVPRWHRIELERDRDGWRAEVPTLDGCEAWGLTRPEAVADCIIRFRAMTTSAGPE